MAASTTSDTEPLTHAETSSIHPLLTDGAIRLLELLPSTDDHCVRCRSIAIHLSQLPAYTALSYAWGSQSTDCTIFVNGRRVSIRKNLWRFLRQSSSFPNAPFKYIWIDALCINQSDLEERTRQVALMGSIFAAAEQVIAWLGPSYNNSDQAMEDIVAPMTWWNTKQRLFKIWSTPKGASIRGICVRPYWKRLWVFQELALAKRIKLMCGAQCISFEAFRDFQLAIDTCEPSAHVAGQFEFDSVRASAAMTIVKHLAGQREKSSLFDLMQLTRDLRCSEVRDRVYALLSIRKPAGISINADYNVSLPSLLNKVLKDKHESQRPRSLDEVTEQCRQLANIMRIESGVAFEYLGTSSTAEPKQETPSQESDQDPMNQSVILLRSMEDGVGEHKISVSEKARNDSLIKLGWAMRWQHRPVLELLFDGGVAELDVAMKHACRHGQYSTVKTILDLDLITDSFEFHFGHALQFASSGGYVEIVELLLEKGADPDMRGGTYGSAICAASRKGHAEIVQLLLENGAEVEATGSDYDSPLYTASICNQVEIVTKLLLWGANVNAHRDRSLYGTALVAATAKGHMELVELLLERGANINAAGVIYSNALDAAIRNRHAELVQLLLKKGASGNAQDAIRAAVLNKRRPTRLL